MPYEQLEVARGEPHTMSDTVKLHYRLIAPEEAVSKGTITKDLSDYSAVVLMRPGTAI